MEQPGLGDRQIKHHLMLKMSISKGFIECLLGFITLFIDELAADLMLVGQVSNRLGLSEDLKSNIFAESREIDWLRWIRLGAYLAISKVG